MDPKKLFADERFSGMCVYCGDRCSTRDHVPSRVLLDEPFPENLPVVPACEKCNNGFSKDEAYLACFVECVINGSASTDKLQREKVKRILREIPGLASTMDACCYRNSQGNLLWSPDMERVRNVVLKLARGHVAYECSESQLNKPDHIAIVPLCTMSKSEVQKFEAPPDNCGWPEIGSRAFQRICVVGSEVFLDDGWQVVQPGRYRYSISYSGPMAVKFVLSEYLACEVIWLN